MKTAEEASQNWVKKSLQAYLEGEKNLKWIAGVLRGMNKDEVLAVLSSLGQYGLNNRKSELHEWLTKSSEIIIASS